MGWTGRVMFGLLLGCCGFAACGVRFRLESSAFIFEKKGLRFRAGRMVFSIF